jgi:hypothetical protein
LQIKKIILSHTKFYAPYSHLKSLHPDINIEICPENGLRNILFICYVFLKSRLNNTTIVFFHECCWEIFDILVLLLKPKGIFLPQVSLGSFRKIYKHARIKSKAIILFKIIGVLRYFDIYAKPNDGLCTEDSYYFSMKSYPRPIMIHSIDYSRKIIIKQKKYKDNINSNKLLFLADRDNVSDIELKMVYQRVITVAQSNNFDCYIKMHPNSGNHIHIENEKLTILNHTIPVELIKDEFKYVIGTGSTGLLYFRERSISILNLLNGMSSENKTKRKAHLTNILGGDKIKFISTVQEFEKLLK